MPDRPSFADSDTVGACAYQPLALSGAGSVAAVLGAVRSMWMSLTDAPVALPALSLTVADAERLSPSPVTVLAAGQGPSMPDRPSEHVHCTVTSPRYQPAPFGAVSAAPDRVGAVSSTLRPVTAVDAL